jgi:hypothetical protein
MRLQLSGRAQIGVSRKRASILTTPVRVAAGRSVTAFTKRRWRVGGRMIERHSVPIRRAGATMSQTAPVALDSAVSCIAGLAPAADWARRLACRWKSVRTERDWRTRRREERAATAPMAFIYCMMPRPSFRDPTVARAPSGLRTLPLGPAALRNPDQADRVSQPVGASLRRATERRCGNRRTE